MRPYGIRRCDVAVIVPVLRRPNAAEPLARSLAESLSDKVRARLIFVCSPGDDDEIAACIDVCQKYDEILQPTGIVTAWEPGPGDYARKINLGYRSTDEQWIFTGADDLRFYARWADNALATATLSTGVIGTNDLGNGLVIQGRHSTHSLVRRTYADHFGVIDQPGAIYFEGYDHQYCDNELVETALHRNAFAAAPASIVEHLHPIWRKAPNDPVYDRGQSGRLADKALYESRRPLWGLK